MIHRCVWVRVLAGLWLAGCGSAEPGGAEERAAVGVQPTPIADEPSTTTEPSGVVGVGEGPGTPCAERAQAMGEQLGATATVTGLPPRDEASEELERVACDEAESDDECLRRAEQRARAEHGADAELDYELGGERRRVVAVIVVDYARFERTFGSVEELQAFVRSESDAGKRVELESMLAEIDPATRVVVVRRVRTLAPGERRGRAHLVVPGTTEQVMARAPAAARQHDMLVEEAVPMGDSVRLTVECQ